MNRRDAAELLVLGALWGASFLFMRIAVPEFGPLALVWLRVRLAALVLLPLLAARGQVRALRTHWRAIAVVGVMNSGLPFLLFMTAALVLSTGLMAILNATAPMWALLVGWAWLGERPSASRALGLVLGLAGVVALSWDRAGLRAADTGPSPALAIALCLAATVCYGWAANFARRTLADAPSLAVATGSQSAAAVVLLLPALWAWPERLPSGGAWASALALALGCTALAYVLYFRLIARAGAASAILVTFLVPLFALVWGALALGERPDATMLGACAVILLGTALSTGLVAPRRAQAPPSSAG